ncbi:MAG TPA: DUF3606 domain-containing protein [Vineibacter sp.]|nr:DUF3606 domain-containing protein [Vineibacter sp.]
MDDKVEQHQAARIDVDAEQHVRYWSKTLHVHPTDLRVAVETVGPMVEDVRRYLKRGNGEK